jgi:hypothetical protein
MATLTARKFDTPEGADAAAEGLNPVVDHRSLRDGY